MNNKNKENFILDPRAKKGIQLFNQKKFFAAHEELELAWRDEQGEIRDLYRGILQIGVAYYHIQNKNFTGAEKMFVRAEKWLASYSGNFLGINVEKLKKDAAKLSRMLKNGELNEINTSDGAIFHEIETRF
jgi:predicted metal-dependent hydrolase